MGKKTKEEFEIFLSQLLETNATLDFYTDFVKCGNNVGKIAIKLNQLNYLIGKDDINAAVHELWEENPKVFSVLDILIAVREKDKKVVLDNGVVKELYSYFNNVDDVITFIRGTGLETLFKNKSVTNLVDYVFGIEVGLDSNSRKNRSGHIMENTVSKILDRHGIAYRKEVYYDEFEAIHNALGEDKKRFDFVVTKNGTTYLIEVNFYNGGGSKPNEVARAYTELAPKINACNGYEFVWITDGKGWLSAKTKLEEAFYAIPSVYNLTTFEQFIESIK